MKTRKLTRKTLSELEKQMPVLNEIQQKFYIGGYDQNDCWWRCIAYLKSCGTDYSADAAMDIASGYYGDDFDENNYAFSGTLQDFKDFTSGYFSGLDNYCPGQILIFDPNATPGWSGNGTSSHSVIIQGYNYDESNGVTIINIFDPQTGQNSTLNQSVISGAHVINVR